MRLLYIASDETLRQGSLWSRGRQRPIGPSFNFAVKEAGFRELVSFLKEDFVELQGSMLVHERIFQSDPALVEKFVRETLKGLRFARKQSRHDSDLTPLYEDQKKISPDNTTIKFGPS